MAVNFEVRSFLLNLSSGWMPHHQSRTCKAAQTIAFYGNGRQVKVLPLSGGRIVPLQLPLVATKMKRMPDRKPDVHAIMVTCALLRRSSLIRFPFPLVQFSHGWWNRRTGCWQRIRYVQGWIRWRWCSPCCLPIHCGSPKTPGMFCVVSLFKKYIYINLFWIMNFYTHLILLKI